jgi:hypothetical protein
MEIKVNDEIVSDISHFSLDPNGYYPYIESWKEIERYIFLVYEYWRLRGDFNMYDFKNISMVSGLNWLMYRYVMDNYETLREKYTFEQRQLETEMLNELKLRDNGQ